MEPRFVDCHSHVVPSGDDGVGTIDEGIALCREAARHGTRVLYATPHVWPHLILTVSREAAVREAFAAVRENAGLELRLGWELTPTSALLDEAYELAVRRLGEEHALRLFDGSALLEARPSRPAARAASTEASLAMPTIKEAGALPVPPSGFKQ